MLEATGLTVLALYLLGMMSSEILWILIQILVVLAIGVTLLRVVHKPQTAKAGKLTPVTTLSLGRYSNV